MSQLNRRQFLSKLGCSLGAASVWSMFPGLGIKECRAATGNGTKVLFINLNGGLDGLAALQPLSGGTFTTLQSMRPTLALPSNQLLPVNANYGLHPNLTELKALHDEGKLGAVLNVGYLNMSRSHMDAEVAMARGVSDRLSASASGLIHRMGASYGWSSLQAVSVTGADRTFDGGQYRGIQVTGLENFYFKGQNGVSNHEGTHRRDALYSVVADTVVDAQNPFQKDSVDGLGLAVNTTDSVRQAVTAATFPNAYPSTRMGRWFKDIDILFSAAGIGTEVGYIRAGGFDTHSNQTPVLNSLLSDFNSALGVFVDNMKAKNIWNNLIVVVFSEFGRTNVENGSAGTDHGGANPVFFTGGLAQSGVIGEITTGDLTGGGWLPMKVNVIEIYRQVVARMGYDPNLVMENPTQTTLPSLFV